MGAMGRYIEALSDKGRDRIISGRVWGSGALRIGEGGCLRGHAEGFVEADHPGLPKFYGWADIQETNRVKAMMQELYALGQKESVRHPAWAFNKAFDRWGPRVVRAIKLRAARLNGSDASTIRDILGHENSAVRGESVGV